MSRNVLLVASAPAEAKAVRRSLEGAGDGPFKVEWVSRCDDACSRLGGPGRDKITAVVVDLTLPDRQGIEAFDTLFRAARHVPILILSRLRDEDVAKMCIRDSPTGWGLASPEPSSRGLLPVRGPHLRAQLLRSNAPVSYTHLDVYKRQE